MERNEEGVCPEMDNRGSPLIMMTPVILLTVSNWALWNLFSAVKQMQGWCGDGIFKTKSEKY